MVLRCPCVWGRRWRYKKVAKIRTVFGLKTQKSILLCATYSFFSPSSVFRIKIQHRIYKVNTYNTATNLGTIVSVVSAQ